MALLGDASLRMLPRGLDEYLERRRRMIEAAAPAPAPAAAAAAKSTASGDSRAAKKELQKIERQLNKLSDRESNLHAQIAENSTDYDKVAKLDAELRELLSERDDLEMRWLELAEDAQ